MSWLRGVYGVLLATVVTAIAYAPSLGNEFAFDDSQVVRAVSEKGQPNPMVHELQPVADYFTTEYWTGTGSAMHSDPLYRPVTVLSYAVTHALLPGDGTPASEARPHHFLYLVLHVLNTLLVYFVTRRWLGRDSFGPIVATFVFGLAAVHAEAVASIVGRADLFAFGFGIGALWCFLALPTHGLRRAVLTGASALLLFLAFCSKESALAWWPFLVCAGLAASLRRGTWSWRDILWPAGLGAVPAIAWFFLRQNAFEGLAEAFPVAYVSNPLRDLDTLPRLFAALLVWGHSLVKTVAPYPLVCDYGASVFAFARPGQNASMLAWLYLLPLAAVLAIGVRAAVGRDKRPLLFLGATAILGFGLPTANVLSVIGTIWAERLAYLPSLGFALFAAWLFDRRTGPVAVVLLAAYLLGSFVIVFVRVDDWKDDATLFAKDVRTQPRSLLLRIQAAVQARQRGDLDTWQRMLEAAIRIEPEWARGYIELGAGVFQRAKAGAPSEPQARARHIAAQLAESERLLRRALDAKILEPSEQTMLWRNFAVLMLQRDRKAEALPWLQKIVDHEPGNVLSRHRVLADALKAYPDEQVLQFLRGGEQAVPGHPAWELHRGLLAARRDDADEARRRLEAALPRMEFLDPTVQHAWLALAQLRARTGDERGASELFGRIARDPRFDPSIRRDAERSR